MGKYSWEEISNGVRLVVTPAPTYYSGQDGTAWSDDGPKTMSQQLEQIQNSALQSALTQLEQYGEIEPLLLQVRQGNPFVMQNSKAQEVVLKALKGKGFKGGKGRRRSRMEAKRDLGICRAINCLHTFRGTPVFDREGQQRTACELVGEHIHKAAAYVYSIWSQHKNQISPGMHDFRLEIINPLNPAEKEIYTPFNSAEKSDNPPTTGEIIEYFLTGEFRPDELTAELNELARQNYRDFADRVITRLKANGRDRYGLFTG